jgi:glutathione S-transferase
VVDGLIPDGQDRKGRWDAKRGAKPMIRIYAFDWVPPFARGLVRDLRVRWALEEAGIDYESITIDHQDKNEADYRALQPFGQVPAFEEDGDEPVALFESGAIVLHIAERSQALLPSDPAERAKAIQWIFAALNSIEPHIQNYALMAGFFKDQEWARLRAPEARKLAESRLDALAGRLGDREHLEARFTAGDLMMTSVLRILRDTDLLEGRQRLQDYVERNEGRPAFQRALDAQLADFTGSPPPGFG